MNYDEPGGFSNKMHFQGATGARSPTSGTVRTLGGSSVEGQLKWPQASPDLSLFHEGL